MNTKPVEIPTKEQAMALWQAYLAFGLKTRSRMGFATFLMSDDSVGRPGKAAAKRVAELVRQLRMVPEAQTPRVFILITDHADTGTRIKGVFTSLDEAKTAAASVCHGLVLGEFLPSGHDALDTEATAHKEGQEDDEDSFTVMTIVDAPVGHPLSIEV